MFANPLMNQMLSQISNNLLNLVVDDKIDNPFLKAALAPMIGTFVHGIMNGTDFSTLGRQTVGTMQPHSFDPQTGQALSGISNSSYLLADTFSDVYKNELLNVKK